MLALLLGCAGLGSDRAQEMDAALADLRTAGFEFDADVRFEPYPYTVCDGMACAELVVVHERRTIRLAGEAFDSPTRLRATLLEVWERYRQPRPGSVPDLARGALRVLRDGRKVGVNDVFILRQAHHIYGQLYGLIPPDQRGDLPDPDSIPFP